MGPMWPLRRPTGPDDRDVTRADSPPLVAAAWEAGVRDRRVLDAMAATPREGFVPASLVRIADSDRPLPLPNGQTTSQPSLIARMVESLGLGGSENVLEVGAGHGYQTALLARLARTVCSVELFPDLAEDAAANLRRQGLTNAVVLVGDGAHGAAAHGPFDGIVVSAAVAEVPPRLSDQLAPGGKLVLPLGPGGHERVVLFEEHDGNLRSRELITLARFVPLLPAE